MDGDRTTHGLWEASAPPAPATQPLRDPLAVDVAIVGGGFTGTSAALHLAEGGASCALLEAHEIGFGASGRNVGLVNAGMWVLPSVLIDELGPEFGPRLLDLLGNGPSVVFDLIKRHRIPCESSPQGTLHCAVGRAGADEIAERSRQWLSRGAAVELLDAGRTAELTGTRAYAGALLDHRAGTVQPLAYVRGLAASAMRSGARLHTRTRVTAARRTGDAWTLATDSGGSVSARWVIVATDAYTQFARAPWPGIQSEQVSLPYFNFATGPLPPDVAAGILPQRQGAWDTRKVLSSFRLDAAGRFIFGSVGALRGTGAAVHRDWARRAMEKTFPQLEGQPFEHAWYGTIGMTSDAMPRFHELDRNVLAICGFNGRGIAPGTVFGRELAQLVLGRITPDQLALPLTGTRPVRFRQARTLGYELGAQALHFVAARR